ncbi:MAG: hypothetical protein QM750_10715 [Rubrivivax sp.]
MLVLAAAALLSGCVNTEQARRQDRAVVAKAMFDERCKNAGVFIHRTVKDVEGILVMKLRPGFNHGDQFRLDDPYGHDLFADGYLVSFLRGSFQANTSGTLPPGSPPRFGYRFVEAVDPADGKRYRYTGSVRDYVVTPNRAFNSTTQPFTTRGFLMDKALAFGEPPRYGLTYDDISTRQEREYWIAGSSLRVIDTQTGEVLAERIGYMWDPGQGNNSGGRSPWLLAANYACPSFYRIPGSRPDGRASGRQGRQALDFVESVAIPKP